MKTLFYTFEKLESPKLRKMDGSLSFKICQNNSWTHGTAFPKTFVMEILQVMFFFIFIIYARRRNQYSS